MKKQLVIPGIVAIFVTVGLSGCSTQNNNENQVNNTNDNENHVNNTTNLENNRFVGTWKNTSVKMTINLFSNGTCLLFNSYGTWDVKDGLLIMEFPNGKNLTYVYRFSNNNRTLYLHFLTDNLETVYTKQ